MELVLGTLMKGCYILGLELKHSLAHIVRHNPILLVDEELPSLCMELVLRGWHATCSSKTWCLVYGFTCLALDLRRTSAIWGHFEHSSMPYLGAIALGGVTCTFFWGFTWLIPYFEEMPTWRRLLVLISMLVVEDTALWEPFCTFTY